MPLQQQQEFLGLILEQVGRVNAVVATYQRLGRVEALRQPRQSLNALVRDVLALQPFAAAPGVQLEVELAQALPPVALDRTCSRARWRTWCATPSRRCRARAASRCAPSTGLRARAGGVVLTVQDTGRG